MITEVPLVSNGDVVTTGTGMTVDYKLKPGMKWSDGSAITCKDLEATWKWNMDPAQAGLAGGTIGWENITAVDTSTDTNCVVTFNAVYEGYLGLFSPLLPAAYIATVPVKDAPTKLYPLTNLASGVYSGPYIPTEYKADAQLNYAVNPNYATIHPEAKLGFPGMIFKIYGSADAMKAGFDAGEYDLGMDMNMSDIPSLQGKNNVLAKDGTTYEQLSLNNATLTKKFGAARSLHDQAGDRARDQQERHHGSRARRHRRPGRRTTSRRSTGTTWTCRRMRSTRQGQLAARCGWLGRRR